MIELHEAERFLWIEQEELTEQDRATLLERGWIEAGDDLMSPQLQEELKRSSAEVEEHPESVITWEQMLRELEGDEYADAYVDGTL